MPTLADTFKREIARVSRKETRPEIDALRKASAQHRSQIIALRRAVQDLEKRLKLAMKSSVTAQPRDLKVEDKEQPRRRYRAGSVAALRGKLGLSAKDFGELVGVSAITVYKWEKLGTRPRLKQLEALAALRGIGKTEAASRLALARQEAPSKRAGKKARR